MGRRKTENGALLELYASEMGLTVKSARAHRDKGAETWKAFVARRPGAGVLHVGPRRAAPVGEDDLGRAQAMKVAAWRQWQAIVAAYDKATGHGVGAETLGKFERATAAAQERYTAAQKAEDDLKARRGLLVPYESILSLQGAVEPLGVLFAGLKDRIGAGIADDAARGAFFAAFEGAMPEWNAGIAGLNEAIHRVLPCF